MNTDFYATTLYPFQDSVLARIAAVDTGFYLTGGTAASWGFCCRLGLSLPEAITNAAGKAAGIFPVDLARVLISATPEDHAMVRWIDPPPPADYLRDLRELGERLALGEG